MLDQKLTTIAFRGAELTAFGGDTPETTMVAMKPIVEGMGLDWGTQFRKLKAHPVLSKGIVIMTIPSAGGSQEMVCLPLPLLPGWQMTVNANKVAPPLRENVIIWQTEASAVLFRHFFGRPQRSLDSAVLDRLVALEKRMDLALTGYDPTQKTVTDTYTMHEIMESQDALKPWRGLGTHCRSRLDRYSREHNLADAVRPGKSPDRYLYQRDLVRKWLTDEGKNIIKAHNDKIRGQGVLQFAPQPTRKPRLHTIPRAVELPPSQEGTPA